MKGKHFNRFFQSNNRIFMFADDLEHSGKNIATFAMEININDGEPSSDWKLISSIEKSRKDEYYTYDISPNADSTLMVFTSSLADKTDESIKVILFNQKLEVKSSTVINLAYAKKAYKNKGILVGADEGIFVFGQVFEDIPYKKSRSKFVFKKTTIEKYDFTGKKLLEIPTDVEDKRLVNAHLAYDNKENLIVAGFYSDDVKAKEINGLFVTRYNANTGAVLMQTEQKLDNALIGKFTEDDDADIEDKKKYSGKIDEDDEGLSPSYGIKQIIIGDDNSIVLLAEKFFFQVYRSASLNKSNLAGGSGVEYTRFYIRDILTVKLGQDGAIKFIHVLPKNQIEACPGSLDGFNAFPLALDLSFYLSYSSFKPFVYKNKLIYIFNDHEKNASIITNNTTAKTVANFKKSECNTVILDLETGKATRNILFSNDDEPIAMISHAMISKENIFFVGYSESMMGKTKIKLGKITVK